MHTFWSVKGSTLTVTPGHLLVAEFTGRDQDAVKRRIRDLAREGASVPDKVPALYRIPAGRLTRAERISVDGTETSGEAEAVFVVAQNELWVGIGSDHTDRGLERTSIPASKQACPKVVGATLWPFAEVKDHWDELLLRSWAGDDPDELRLYQEGRLRTLLLPSRLVDLVMDEVGEDLEGTVLFTGTMPVVGGSGRAARYYRMALIDERLGRELTCAYEVVCESA